jgi:hypothetical protein
VAGRLAQPAPEFLEAIAAVKGCGLLTQRLALAEVSPFSGLPDATEEAGGFPAAVPAGRMDLERRVAAPAERAEGVAERKPGGGAQAPVFSFRRREAGTVEAAGAPAGATGVHEIAARARSATELPAVERRGSAAAGAAPAVPPVRGEVTRELEVRRAERAVPGMEVRRPDEAVQAIELLDALASELLGAPGLEPAPLRAGAAPDASAAAREAAPAFDAARGQEPRLAPVLRIDDRSLTVAAQTIAVQNERAAVPAEARPGVRSGSAFGEAPGATQSSQLDAETVAAMVNEVLAEQARRHGVDLS